MKEFFQKPAVLIISLILVFIIGASIGNSDWFKNLFVSKPNPNPDGGGNGNGNGGGGFPIDTNIIERNKKAEAEKIISEIQQAKNSTSRTSNSSASCNKLSAFCANNPDATWCWSWYDKVCGGQERTTAPAPKTILMPISGKCYTYTSMNPYKANGCSYVFAGYALDKGVRKCILRLISCP